MTAETAAEAEPRGVTYMRLDEIRPAEVNPKGHDQAAIGRSIAHHGLAELPLLDGRTGRLVAGHGRLEQLDQMLSEGKNPPDGVLLDADGMWKIPVITGWSSRSDDDALAYLVGSNQITIAGSWDYGLLAPVMQTLKQADLDALTGFDDIAVAAILKASAASEPAGKPVPSSFPKVGLDLSTDYCCPSCGYEWSGSKRPASGLAQGKTDDQ